MQSCYFWQAAASAPGQMQKSALPGTLDGLRRLSIRECRRICTDLAIDMYGLQARDDYTEALFPHSAAAATVACALFDANFTRLSGHERLRLIFLDVDGVLNSSRARTEDVSVCGKIERDTTRRLASLVNRCSAAIVLSTSWRATPFLKVKHHVTVLAPHAEHPLALAGGAARRARARGNTGSLCRRPNASDRLQRTRTRD